MFWEGAMFLRVVRAAGAKGVKNEYVRVVEAYRENGKTRHRTVLNLGRRDLLAAHLDLDKLRRLLQGDADRAMADRAIRREDIGALAAWDWGPMLVAGHLWRELGLEATLDKLAAPARHCRAQPSAQRRSVRIHPERHRAMERMPGGHYRTREGVIAQDAGSGGLIHSTGRAGVRGALGRTRGVRAQAASRRWSGCGQGSKSSNVALPRES